MDWYPLLNSLRIAAISTVLVFFLGILTAYYAVKLPRVVKGILDVLFMLPLVLPPTVVGYFLLRAAGPQTVGLLAFGGVRVKVDDGLVFCGPCRFSGSFSNDVSNRAGGL